jgi:2-hydroxychromene-2-carboxylate isomerase
MDVGSESLRFYFDYTSPYAYLAWTQIHAIAERFDLEVEPMPVLASALLDGRQAGGIEAPNKRAYVLKDSLRLARRFSVPLVPPVAPFDAELALALTSLPMSNFQKTRLIDALFAAAWGGAGGLAQADAMAAAAVRAGLDGAALVKAASTQEARDRVALQTDEARVEGVFGVPSVLVDGELFYGVDALAHLETFLEGRDLVAGIDVSRWARLSAA